MTGEAGDAVIDIWPRKHDYCTSPEDGSKEDHLTNQSRERVAHFKEQTLDRRKSLLKRIRDMARRALNGI